MLLRLSTSNDVVKKAVKNLNGILISLENQKIAL